MVDIICKLEHEILEQRLQKHSSRREVRPLKKAQRSPGVSNTRRLATLLMGFRSWKFAGGGNKRQRTMNWPPS